VFFTQECVQETVRMKLTAFLLVAVVCAAVVVSAGDVVELTESTFDDFIASNEHVLVKFVAPWYVRQNCGCMQLCVWCGVVGRWLAVCIFWGVMLFCADIFVRYACAVDNIAGVVTARSLLPNVSPRCL